MSVGIERLTGYIPSYALSLKDLALARNVPPEKMTAGLGVHEMAIAAPCEDVVTLAASAGLAATPAPSLALSAQQALLVAVPAVALVSAEVEASATVNCGRGPIAVSPKPLIEVGTGWFVDGQGYLVTNAHVIDAAYRVPPWVEFTLKLRAVEEGCVDPALKARGLARGERHPREP